MWLGVHLLDRCNGYNTGLHYLDLAGAGAGVGIGAGGFSEGDTEKSPGVRVYTTKNIAKYLDKADIRVPHPDSTHYGGAWVPAVGCRRGFDLEHPAGPPHPAHKYLTDIDACHRLSDHIVLEGGAVAWFALDDEH